MLYRSTDRLCRCGASMKNLAHSASFESLDKNAPSKAETKHLGYGSEAAGMARDFAFGTLGLRRLAAGHAIENIAFGRILLS
jgi:hypothetical protein